MSKTIVVIGAGPAGLACAYKLLEKGDFKVTLIEKASFVGGLGGSFNWKEHILDFGPHAFHTKGGEPESLMRNLFKDDPQNLIVGKKRVSVYLNGKFYKYPLQVGEVLKKFNPFLSIRIIIEFIFTSIVHGLVAIPIENFEIWGNKKFGRKLYRLGFGDYTEKVWKTKASDISAKFAPAKIQGFSFIHFVKKLFKIGGEVTEPYFQTWLYPKMGSAELYKRLASKIEEKGGAIVLNAELSSVLHKDGKVECIEYASNGEKISIKPDYVISTIHLGHLGNMLVPEPPFIASHHFQKLKYISLIVVYLELNIDKISDMHWFYLLDKSFRFNRVAEQKNLCKDSFKTNKTVLSMELSCRYGDKLWNMNDEELINMAKDDITKVPIIDGGMISAALVKRFPNAYELYYKNFDKHADISLAYVNSIKGLSSVGRRGLFLQGDQHQSVEMGLEIGNILLQKDIADTSVNDYYKKYVRYVDEI